MTTSRQAKAAHRTKAWADFERELLAKHPELIGSGTTKKDDGNYAIAVYVEDEHAVSPELKDDVPAEFRPLFRKVPVTFVGVGACQPFG